MKMNRFCLFAFFSALLLVFSGCEKKKTADTVKIGVLHSLTGTMAISEIPVRNAVILAVEEINKSGGVLGKQIEVVEEDGASNAQVFADKAKKLLSTDKVSAVFGCWTSDSRKAVKRIFEESYGLLWYPVQYEGMEASPNIMYMGAAPNQQVVPAIEYCSEHFGKRFFLLGSDYVFPRTVNRIIKAEIASFGGKCVGELYSSLGTSDFKSAISQIKDSSPDVIINTLNGDSNVAFFKQIAEADFEKNIPIMSFSISENEVEKIGVKYLQGHLLTWNYFETIDSDENKEFIANYKTAFGADSEVGDPVEAAYIAVHLWAMACEKAKSFDVESVRIAVKGLTFSAPEGEVTLDGGNQHLYKRTRIGVVNGHGEIDEIWTSPQPVKPDPYLSTYSWARGLWGL